jgi:hypothetical protein
MLRTEETEGVEWVRQVLSHREQSARECRPHSSRSRRSATKQPYRQPPTFPAVLSDERFEILLRRLRAYVKRTGHPCVPKQHLAAVVSLEIRPSVARGGARSRSFFCAAPIKPPSTRTKHS